MLYLSLITALILVIPMATADAFRYLSVAPSGEMP